jgi:eukaryotic-like serine/threonine-protein kinase
MLEPGTLLNGRYRIAHTIGQGGMGVVYKAVDTRLQTTVALKQTLVSAAGGRAFEQEARLLATLRHPALPVVSDYFSEGAAQCLVMQFIPGDDLASKLAQRHSPFTLAEVVGWAEELLDALSYLHRQAPAIIHRDIKPQNLKLAEDDRIILLDFGLAKGRGGLSVGAAPASIFGYTPQYAPLEQIQGTGTSPASDLYSLAATLYHLLCGAPPPDALTRAAALVGRRIDPLAPLEMVVPEAPRDLSAVLQRMLCSACLGSTCRIGRRRLPSCANSSA